MRNLKKEIKNRLSNAKKVAVLGIGSELISDDAAGMLVVRQLKDLFRPKKNKNFRVFLGHSAPENLTGRIKKFCPTHLLIIDAADFGAKAGNIHFIDSDDIGGVAFSTHRLPTKILADYLKKELNCKIDVVGIQPKALLFCAPVSEEIKEAASKLSSAIKEAFNSLTLPV